MNFFDKLAHTIAQNDSLLCVGLDPNPMQMPDRYRNHNGDMFADIRTWNRAIIDATADLACVYKPNIAFYEALGQSGCELLRQTLDYIPNHMPVILDAKRGDIGSTAAAYAQAVFEVWGVDAVTLSPYLGRDSIDPFAAYAEKGLFVLSHTSNPGAGEFQHSEISDWRTLDREPNQPLYIHVARTATQWSPNVGLVVGATYPDEMRAVRAAVPHTWFLVPGVGTQGGDVAEMVQASLRADGSGIVVNASRSIALADDPHNAAFELKDAINQAREQSLRFASRPQTTSSPSASSEEARDVIVGLAQLGAVQFDEFTLASGAQAPFYIDLRLLVSQPSLLTRAAHFYAAILKDLSFDRIAGVPYAALPIGTAVSTVADVPMIYPRKEAKAHGLGKNVEGIWHKGERIVIIEDVITSGGSVIKSAEQLRALGLIVEDVIVLIDREQGGVAKLAAAGIRAHGAFTLTEVLDVLVDAGELDDAKRRDVLDFIGQ